MEVIRSSWRRRWQIVGLALVAGIAAGGTTALRPARYPAEALVELHLGKSDPSAPIDAPSASVVVEAPSIVLGEARIIRSSLVARRVVEQLNLMNDPAFVSDGLSRRTMAWLFGQGDIKDEKAARIAEAERALAAGLSVQTDNRSYLIAITYTASKPEMSARIANTVAQVYLARRVEANVDGAAKAAVWLDGQIVHTQTELRNTDQALATFRDQTGLTELDAQIDSVKQLMLREFAVQRTAATLARITAETRLDRIEELQQTGSAASAPELQSLPPVQAATQREAEAERALAELQTRLGPKHPAVQQAQAAVSDGKVALAVELDKAVKSLKASLDTSRQTEQTLRGRVEAMQRTQISDVAKQAELHNLVATANSLRERLQSLRRSRDQALALRDLGVVPASLIVPAQPSERPAGLSALLVGVLGFGFGGLIGIALAAVLEQTDNGFRTNRDATSATALRCLGLVPELSPDDVLLAEPYPRATSSPQVVFDEAVRTVASGVGLFGSADGGSGHRDGGRIVLVTSAMPDEGCRTLCAGLARAISQTGRRVLLVDGRPRRFDRDIAFDGERPSGADAAGCEAAARVIPIGTMGNGEIARQSNEAIQRFDVFASPRPAAVLDEARRHFDLIVVQGPPVMLLADALVIGGIADTVLLAVRWSGTKQRVVTAALRRLEEHNVIVDGIVVTRVDVQKHSKLALDDDNSLHLSLPDHYANDAAPSDWHPLAAASRMMVRKAHAATSAGMDPLSADG